MKTNQEANKLIADFMERRYDYLACDACDKIDPELDSPETGSRVTKCCPKSIGNYGKTYRPYGSSSADLKYDTSWDWLMPVIEKISKLNLPDTDGSSEYWQPFPRTFGMTNDDNGNFMFRFNRYCLHEAPNLIDAAYSAVVDFISTLPTKGGSDGE